VETGDDEEGRMMTNDCTCIDELLCPACNAAVEESLHTGEPIAWPRRRPVVQIDDLSLAIERLHDE